MKTQVKRELKQRLQELAPLIPDEGKEAFNRISRLFGEVRQDFSLLNSQLAGAEASRNELKKSRDSLNISLELATQRSDALTLRLRECQAQLATVTMRSEQLSSACGLLIDSCLQPDGTRLFQSPAKVIVSDAVEDIARHDEDFLTTIGVLVIHAVVLHVSDDRRTADGGRATTYHNVGVCVCVSTSSSGAIIVTVCTSDEAERKALAAGVVLHPCGEDAPVSTSS